MESPTARKIKQRKEHKSQTALPYFLLKMNKNAARHRNPSQLAMSTWGVTGVTGWMDLRVDRVLMSLEDPKNDGGLVFQKGFDQVVNEICGKCENVTTRKNKTQVFRNSLKTHFLKSGCGGLQLPPNPQYITQAAKAQGKAALEKRQNDPVVYHPDRTITNMISGLKFALEKELAPMVSFCLGHVIALRPNDLNTRHQRLKHGQNIGTVDLDDDYELVPAAAGFVGTIVNLRPSKSTTSTLKYSTVFLCQPADYPLVFAAFDFLKRPGIQRLKCYSDAGKFPGTPCGPESPNREWRHGVNDKMIQRLSLRDCVRGGGDWFNIKEKYNGRRFTTAMIEQGCFYFGDDAARNSFSPGRNIGHQLGSSADQNYFVIKLDPPPGKREGVELVTISDTTPIQTSKGFKITYRTALRPIPSSPMQSVERKFIFGQNEKLTAAQILCSLAVGFSDGKKKERNEGESISDLFSASSLSLTTTRGEKRELHLLEEVEEGGE